MNQGDTTNSAIFSLKIMLQNTLCQIFYTFVLENCRFCLKVQFIALKKWILSINSSKPKRFINFNFNLLMLSK